MNKSKDVFKMDTIFNTVFNNKTEVIMKNTFKLTLLLSALAIPGAVMAMERGGMEDHQRAKMPMTAAERTAIAMAALTGGSGQQLSMGRKDEGMSFAAALQATDAQAPGVCTQASGVARLKREERKALASKYLGMGRLVKRGEIAALQAEEAKKLEEARDGDSGRYSESALLAAIKTFRTEAGKIEQYAAKLDGATKRSKKQRYEIKLRTHLDNACKSLQTIARELDRKPKIEASDLGNIKAGLGATAIFLSEYSDSLGGNKDILTKYVQPKLKAALEKVESGTKS